MDERLCRSLPNFKDKEYKLRTQLHDMDLFVSQHHKNTNQAEAEIRNKDVSADRDPAGIASADSVSAVSDSAGGNPAGSFQPAASYEPVGPGNPAVSTDICEFEMIALGEDTFFLGLQSETLPEDLSTGGPILNWDGESALRDEGRYKPKGRLVDNTAASTMVMLVAILSAGRLVSAGSTMILLVVILPAGCLVSAGSIQYCCQLYIIPADRLVSAGCTMVLLVVILPAGRMVSAGCTMVLLVVILPAGCFVSAGSYGLCC
ncbi:hypothetical protein Tco_0311950 [Tanacetum coccineum]